MNLSKRIGDEILNFEIINEVFDEIPDLINFTIAEGISFEFTEIKKLNKKNPKIMQQF